ncbi:outer membrane beta-barrel protein [Pedobacter borealis]|uniref:outer membrane beta-barrel protein n=1 Tax=Pedobacter borealis TaxID=475254 RepID=UPI000493A4E6|nr:outer membrane beta-barrel family protein [Pedobacter borealis]
MKYAASLVILLLPIFLFGQKITGEVKDKNNKPLQFVNISIKDNLGANAGNLITDINGQFTSIDLKNDFDYVLSFSLIGYITKQITIKRDQNRNTSIVLLEAPKQLNEVSVSGRKSLIERKVDRLVFNVENNVNTIGFDGLDLLGKTPMVRVEDSNISLIGKQGVAIMVDDKLVRLSGAPLADYLKSIRASNISKIEVITNPPAEYDAEGNSGLINIITKKIKDPGYFVSISERAARTSYNSSGTGVNANYNLKKVLMFANLNGGIGANGPTSSISRYYQAQTWNQFYGLKEKSKYLSGAVGFDYSPSKNTTIGASYNGNVSFPDMLGNSEIRVVNNSTGILDSIIHAEVIGDKSFKTNAANIHFTRSLDSLGRDLQFDADYFLNKTNIENNSTNYNTLSDERPTISPINNIRSGNLLTSTGYTFNLLMHWPTKKFKFTFGGKASFINSVNDVKYNQFFTQSATSGISYLNEFRFRENTQAIFGSMNTSFGKFKFQFGLRTEATQTEGVSPSLSQVNKNSYISLFPTLYLTYPLSKKDVISISYGRRIGRPNFSSFNPFRIYYNQYEYYTGNPYLNPSFTDNLELSNTFNNILSSSISYSVSHGLPTSVQTISNNSNISASTVGNFLNIKSLYLGNSISVKPFIWLESYNQVSVYYNSTKSSSSVTQPGITGYGSSFRSINSLNINKAKTITGGIDFTYQFPETSGIYRNESYYYFDLAVNSVFFNKNLQVSISARDIFKTKFVSSYTIYNNIGVYNSSNNDSRRLILTLRYSFGNSKMSKGQNHISSGAEQGRSGN